MSVMLYKHPGKHKLHGDNFDYVIVDEEEVDKAKSEGWKLTTAEAKEASTKTKDNSQPSREELVQKADELGLDYASNISSKNLLKKINEALEE